MFRPFYLRHHQVELCPVRGNSTTGDIKSLVSNEISFSSTQFFVYLNIK